VVAIPRRRPPRRARRRRRPCRPGRRKLARRRRRQRLLDARRRRHGLPFGEAKGLGKRPGRRHRRRRRTDPSGHGYWILTDDGKVSPTGDATVLGNLDIGRWPRASRSPASPPPDRKGLLGLHQPGRAVGFGDATFFGDVSTLTLNGPVLDSVATPTGQGYYMVASDGGIFAFGDAKFAGSMGGKHLNAPVQSLVPDADGKGYWLVASDGGIFAFDAPFKGSMGDRKLNAR